MGFRRKETVMNKIILIMLLALASFGINFEAAAQGIMLNGVMLEETAHVGTRNLLLNGAGVRSKYIFDVYVAALYLREKRAVTKMYWLIRVKNASLCILSVKSICKSFFTSLKKRLRIITAMRSWMR
jgi:hypothetical protein